MSAIVRAFLLDAEQRGLSHHTIESWQRMCDAIIVGCRDCRVNHLTANRKQAQAVLAHLKQARGWGNSTVGICLKAWRAMARYAVTVGALDVNRVQDVPYPQAESRLPNTITKREAWALFDVVAEYKGPRAEMKRLIMEMLYVTGIRVSELATFQVSCIGDDSIRVIGKGNKERQVPITEQLHAMLIDYVENHRPSVDHDYLLTRTNGDPVKRTDISAIVGPFGKRAGIEGLTPHGLRHAFATHLLDAGAGLYAIKEMLGHSSVQTTERYAKVSDDAVKRAHRRHPRGK